ncbi:MAG: hypothetical protein IT379_15665 [Deltaproteobacteria bacterium]|nr:hypothetical protein [Deltaproteobacteria bacterium]
MRAASFLLAVPLVLGCASGEVADEIDASGGGLDLGPLPPPPPDTGPATDAGPRSDAGPGLDGGPTPPPPGDGGPVPPPPRDAGPSTPCGSMDCALLDGPCTYGECVDDRCVATPRDDGTACNDFDPCTSGEACRAGECQPGTPLDCSEMTSECGVGACNPATSACYVMPRNEGGECPGPAMECGSWACRAGVCSAVAAADGTACSGPAMDCVGYACRAGSCGSVASTDCSRCGAGSSYCAAGVCGPSPTTLSYGFESGLPAGWTTSGDAPWFAAEGAAHGGSFRAESGDIGSDEQTSLSTTISLATAASLSFWLNTSTESCCDLLELFVDGVEVGQWSGTTATQATFPLAAGMRTLEWRYSKDGSVNTGSDSVWIDDVTIGPGAPVEGFEGGSLPAGFTGGGTTGWSIVSSGARTGTFAAASTTIGHGETSSLLRTVTLSAPGNVRFAYRVSSESTYDELSFWIDGVSQAEWSGDVAWTSATYSLGAGMHTLEWRYTKDGSVSSGSDRAWIDDVEVGDPPSGAPLCGG